MRRSWRLTAALALVLAAGSFLFSAWLFTRQASDQNDRRDQACRLFERNAAQDVRTFHDTRRQLADTLDYVAKVPPGERGTQLNQAIKASLPKLRDDVGLKWDDAKASQAPPYCDEPGVGLAEPNPVLPPRPG